eukprot:CAMPEP_0194484012 /NCGR_PEP_ID=MMETSP0253-20130528/5476_1 /TAXON_ID=2966 /ORGANISM="Noctiluca scintillans" /LENGTH=174 /DNA_ID=CAMNT_0039323757 /DNA_START=37 /DNA_END=562 /DNA_ORIENTATION=+
MAAVRGNMVSNEQHDRVHSGDGSPAELTAADWVACYQAEIGHAPPTASALMSFSRHRGGSVNYKTIREALTAALGSSPLVAVPTGIQQPRSSQEQHLDVIQLQQQTRPRVPPPSVPVPLRSTVVGSMLQLASCSHGVEGFRLEDNECCPICLDNDDDEVVEVHAATAIGFTVPA